MSFFNKVFKNFALLKNVGGDVYCANCGARTGIITRERLIDEKCLCVNCQNALPDYYRQRFDRTTLEEYTTMLGYMTETSKPLGKKFKKKQVFSSLQLDTTNCILRYKTAKAVPLYVEFENISKFSLDCHCSRSGYGEITLTLECIKPYFCIIEKLETKGFERDCIKFMDYFYSIVGYKNIGGDKEEEEPRFEANDTFPNTTLQNALALFMFDSIEDVTAENLKVQRNRLIKSFHPDTGAEADTKFAQKINDAYALLSEYVK